MWPVPGLGGWVILLQSPAQVGKHKPDPEPHGGASVGTQLGGSR